MAIVSLVLALSLGLALGLVVGLNDDERVDKKFQVTLDVATTAPMMKISTATSVGVSGTSSTKN